MNKLEIIPANRLSSILRLQREIRQAQQERELEEVEQDLIKQYKMVQGNYKVIITIYEASQLLARPDNFLIFHFSKEHCNSFVEIECNGETKKSKVRPQTNNPIFDERFYFSFENMTQQQLETATIKFSVYDRSAIIIKSSLVGLVELDWTNVYFRRNHEIYCGWLALYATDGDREDLPIGYLLVNVAVLGPQDKQTIHDSKYIKDPLTTLDETISIKKSKLVDYTIKVQIFRAQHLVPIDTLKGQVKAYVVAKFSGHKIRTSQVRSSNPQWNEMLKIGAKVPTKSKYLILELWARQPIFDDLIGVVKIPFSDVVDGKIKQPRWANLYGPPMGAKDKQPLNYATKMQLYGQTLGSHYRGRLLYNVQGLMDVFSKTVRQPIILKFPYRPTPNVKQKTYTLRVYAFQGFEMPGKDNSELSLHVAMGPYLLSSSKVKMQKGMCNWYQKLEDKKVVFPCGEGNQYMLPDVVVYLANGDYEKNRMSFIRLNAGKIVTDTLNPQVNTYELAEDKSLGLLASSECGGYLTLKLQLFSDAPPAPLDPLQYKSREIPYELRLYLYCGQGIPPANASGDSDPYVLFRCGGSTQMSRVVYNSLNPSWYQTITMNVTFPDVLASLSSKGIMCVLYDDDSKAQKPNPSESNFIGRFWVPIQPRNKALYASGELKDKKDKVVFLHQKPKWFHVRNQAISLNERSLGKILLGWSLIKLQNASTVIIPASITPKMDRIKLQVFLIGVRSVISDQTHKWDQLRVILNFSEACWQINPNFGKPEQQRALQGPISSLNDNAENSMSMKSGKSSHSVSTQQSLTLVSSAIMSQPSKLKHGGCNLSSLFFIEVMVPVNRNLLTFMDIKLQAVSHGGSTELIGYGSTPVREMMPRRREHTERDNQEQDQETLLDVDKLEEEIAWLHKKRDREQRAKDRAVLGVSATEVGNKLRVPSEFNDGVLPTALDQQLDLEIEHLDQDIQEKDEFAYVRKLEQEHDAQQQKLRSLNKPAIQLQNELGQNQQSQPLIGNAHFSDLEKQPNFRDTPLDLAEQSIRPIQMIPVVRDVIMRMMPFDRQRLEEIRRNKQKMQSKESIKKDVAELEQRYTNRQPEEIHSFQIKDDDTFSVANAAPGKAIKFADIEKQHRLEKEQQIMAEQKSLKYKYSSAVKLTLFKWRQKHNKLKDEETYQDFDTDPEENLDITPEWYKGRKVLPTDYEDLKKPSSKLKDVAVYCGENKDSNDLRVRKKLADVKLMALSEWQEEAADKKIKYYIDILRPKVYTCRLYFLKGKSLVSENREKPNTYLTVSYGESTVSLKDKTLCKQSSNPQYYVSHDIIMELPGPSTVRVEVVEAHTISKDRPLGYSQIDIQSRYLTRNWHLLLRKPIELRNLYSDYGCGSQGRLQMWIDLIEKKNWQSTPPQKIAPPPYDEYQLRVIVWGTKGCVHKDLKQNCNDLYVRGFIGTGDPQETDVHWRCRGRGSFNWRWKFKVNYPPKPEEMYADVLTVQLWDKDVVGYNDMVGEARINLNRIHRLIQKAVKRRKPTQAKMKIVEKGMQITDRFYFDVYNDKQLDQFGNRVSQGKVQLSFQLIPIPQAEQKYKNGYGRSEPNVYPTLPDPTGRLSFDCMHPLNFLKQILGKQLYNSLFKRTCCAIGIVLLILLIYIIISQIIAGKANNCCCK